MALKSAGGVLCAVVAVLLGGCAEAPWKVQRDANASEAADQAGGGSGGISSATTREGEGAESIHLDPNAIPMRLNVSIASGSGSKDHSSKGYGVEYSRIHYGSGSLSDGEFVSIFYENLDPDRSRAFGYRFVYGKYSLPQGAPTATSITSANSLSIDGLVKFYRPNFGFISSPYLLLSAGLGTLQWEYRTPVTDASGYSFSQDSLNFIELKAGIGGELGRLRLLQLSAYVGPVGRIYLERTSQGFNNDLFDNRLDLTWGATLGLRF